MPVDFLMRASPYVTSSASRRFLWSATCEGIVTCNPQTGFRIPSLSSDLILDPLSADSGYTLQSVAYSSPLYLHSIPDTKSFCFHTCTLNSHAAHVSAGCSFPF